MKKHQKNRRTPKNTPKYLIKGENPSKSGCLKPRTPRCFVQYFGSRGFEQSFEPPSPLVRL